MPDLERDTSSNPAVEAGGAAPPDVLAVAGEPDDGRPAEHHRIVIVGAGFAGIGMAITLKQAGYHDFVVLERAQSTGGVWRDNTYPGCQCDVESHLYSFSFALKPDWSRTFGLQEEIWRYLEDCATRFEVRPHLRLGAGMLGARWDSETQQWHIRTEAGRFTAGVLIAGVGGLSAPNVPRLPGLETFKGVTFHSATWRSDYDLAGKRIAVIGTGASALQFVPAIQPAAGRLFIFQRTPPWVVPRMDRPVGERVKARFRKYPWLLRAYRALLYVRREATVLGFQGWRFVMRYLTHVARKHMNAQVPDAALRAKLTPSYTIGCKRILLSDEWYPAIQQPNVELVTDGIAEIRAHSIVTKDGREREVDAIVFGTGFNVSTHPAFELIYGSDGRSLGDVWSRDGLAAYKGTTVSGYPNLFLLTGPNTGLGHSSIILMLESQFAYVLGALRELDATGAAALDPEPGAQARFNEGMQRRLARTVWNAGGCASWYLDKNGRNGTLWPGSTWGFRLLLRKFDPAAYRVVERKQAVVGVKAP